MTPMSFRSFRDRLETASGFQSAQFREFEFLLGYKRADMLQYQPPGSPGHERAGPPAATSARSSTASTTSWSSTA